MIMGTGIRKRRSVKAPAFSRSGVPGVDTCRIVPCCALPQSCPIVAYRGIASHFYAPIGAGHKMFPTLMSKLLCGKDLAPGVDTSRIVPCCALPQSCPDSRISWDYIPLLCSYLGGPQDVSHTYEQAPVWETSCDPGIVCHR